MSGNKKTLPDLDCQFKVDHAFFRPGFNGGGFCFKDSGIHDSYPVGFTYIQIQVVQFRVNREVLYRDCPLKQWFKPKLTFPHPNSVHRYAAAHYLRLNRSENESLRFF